MLCMAFALLSSMPLLAQSGIKSPAAPQEPMKARVAHKPLEINLDLNSALAELDHLDGKLASLDAALKGFEIKLAPHLAAVDKLVDRQLQHFAEGMNLDDHANSGTAEERDRYVQTAEKVKTLSKSYPVDAKDKLAINNQYGKVTINTWPKNEIKVDVEIKAYESSDDKAQDLLDGVSISESRQGDLISFKTNINNRNISWWSRTKNGKESKRGVQINYVVYMPAKNPLDITNRYGSTVLADFEGPVNINSSYGSLTGGNLGNAANRIKVSYGSANIESFSAGSMDLAYGSLKLARADKLSADIRYSSAKIGKLTSGGNLDLAYGDCKIETLDKSIKNLVVNASYSGLNIGIDEAANFEFDVTVSYAGFNFNDDKVKITSRTPGENAKGFNPTKNYKGTFGKGSDSRVIIKSNYGGVKFL
jgi:hypothetical protein